MLPYRSVRHFYFRLAWIHSPLCTIGVFLHPLLKLSTYLKPSGQSQWRIFRWYLWNWHFPVCYNLPLELVLRPCFTWASVSFNYKGKSFLSPPLRRSRIVFLTSQFLPYVCFLDGYSYITGLRKTRRISIWPIQLKQIPGREFVPDYLPVVHGRSSQINIASFKRVYAKETTGKNMHLVSIPPFLNLKPIMPICCSLCL